MTDLELQLYTLPDLELQLYTLRRWSCIAATIPYRETAIKWFHAHDIRPKSFSFSSSWYRVRDYCDD